MVAHPWNISGRINKKATRTLPGRQGGRQGELLSTAESDQVYILSVLKKKSHTHTAASSCPNNPHGSTCPELCSRWALWLLVS